MSHQHTTFQTLSLILRSLAAILILPLAASAAVCPVDVTTPAILSVDAPSEIHLDPKSLRDSVVLERSKTHLIVAVATPTVLIFDTSACDLRITLDSTNVREHRIPRSDSPAVVNATSFMPRATNKEEDHEFDPDPLKPVDVVLKEEDHEFDPDPLNAADFIFKEEDHEFDPDPLNVNDFVLKEEDHEFDPDPMTTPPVDERALVSLIHLGADTGSHWADDWSAASEVIAQLGPGWYFLVRDGAVIQEILIDAAS